MWLEILAVAAGLGLLVGGADRFVLGAAGIARRLGVSPLLIGLTIVAFGTSAPEMLVSAVAAWQGNPELGIGNAIGSNITNVALVIGVTAVVAPLTVRSELLTREFPILFAVMLLAMVLMIDGELDRVDALILMLGLGVLVYWMVRLGLETRGTDPMTAEYSAEVPEHLPLGRAVVWFGVGLVLLLVSSRMLVWGAVSIAHALGVSDLVIGLSIVAVGTSLPELAASVMSALKGEHDIAIGNVLGSNMFNLLGVLAMPGLIQPGAFSAQTMTRDFPVMIGLTLALFSMAYGFGGRGRVTRIEGGVLVTIFCAYMTWLYVSAI